MTPIGRKRKARAAHENIRRAHLYLVEANRQIGELADDIGIRPPLLVTIIEAVSRTLTAHSQLTELIDGPLTRAAKR